MSITSKPMSRGTDAERRNAFLERLSDGSLTRTLDDRLGIYTQLLGLRPRKGKRLNPAEMVMTGLPVSAGRKLAEHMGVRPQEFLIRYVGMSSSTLRRRVKLLRPLSMRESERVIRYANLLALATKLMSGCEQSAREWLSSPAFALGGSTPLETAVTEVGARQVEELIVSLEHGMFS